MPALPDEPHALIGNTQSVAWITPRGTIGWAAFPFDDGAPIFDGLAPSGPFVPMAAGVFELEPVGPYTATRHYVGETPVLQTLYETADGGKASVLDFLPLRSAGVPGVARVLKDRLVRVVEGHAGAVRFHVRFAPRPDGVAVVDLQLDPNGLVAAGDRHSALLQTEASFDLQPGEAVGDFVLAPGEKRHFLLSVLAGTDPDVPEVRASEADWELDGTFDFWLAWARVCPFQGVQRGHILALATRLKAIAVPPDHQGGRGPRLFDGPTMMLAPLALAAWGWEDELARALAVWRPNSALEAERTQAAWLLEGLAIAQRTGLVEATLILPHWPALSTLADAFVVACAGAAEAPIDALVAAWAGLRAAVALAEDLLLPGDLPGWRAGLSGSEAVLRDRVPAGPLAEALGLVPASANSDDLDGPAGPVAACWQVRRELAVGGYLQARRLMDRLLQTFDPLGCWPGARHADPAALALVLWTAAEVYLQAAPTPGRIDLPGDWGA